MAKYKVLVSDPLAEEGIEVLKKDPDIEVVAKAKMKPEELFKEISDADALIVRSETKVTPEVIAAAKKLRVIGRAGVGVDNVDIKAASKKGIIVMNTPDGNTISAAEHTISMLMSMARNIPQANATLRAGQWERKKFTGIELYGKTIGIIGLGRIGREVAKRSKSFGMRILGNDPYMSSDIAEKIGVELVKLEDIFRQADFITVHTPKTAETKHLIGKKEMEMMKGNARLINCARGGIIDESALLDALKSGKIAGAAIDVFETEPAVNNPLVTLDNVVATPHLGASTEEAQVNVAIAIAHQIINALKDINIENAVNMPAVDAKTMERLKPYLTLTEKLGRLLSQIVEGHLKEIQIDYNGEISPEDLPALTLSLLKGLLDLYSPEMVNYVNAPIIAQERGIKIIEKRQSSATDFANLVKVQAKTDKGSKEVWGTVFGKSELRIVNIDGYDMDVDPTDYMLVLSNHDTPGVVGSIGTLLGKKGINIAGLNMGRKQVGGKAVTVLNIDNQPSPEVMKELSHLPNLIDVKVVKL